jgi:hypothetical protein
VRKALLCAVAFAALPAGLATADNIGLKVTGGGQVVFGDQGAGNTIAFNAQQTSTTPFTNADGSQAFPAKGQLQVNDRENGEKFHGVVTCIRTFDPDNDPSTDNDVIRFGGYNKRTPTDGFTVDTRDNGEPNQGQDLIAFRHGGDPSQACDDADSMTQFSNGNLARGNVQEH